MKLAISFVLAALAVVSASSPAAAGAGSGAPWRLSLEVYNDTPNCAWVTLYTSTMMSAEWDQVKDPTNRPRWINPGQSYRFHGDSMTMSGFKEEIRVRAEVMKSKECVSNRIYDTQTTWKQLQGQPELRTHLKKGSEGNFFFTYN